MAIEPHPTAEPRVDIRIVEGDAIEFVADVLVLKYAQEVYGVDELVVDKLDAAGEGVRRQLPKPGGFTLFDAHGHLGAERVLLVGVVELPTFGYEEIREFSRRAMMSLSGTLPGASHVALTLHGAGYGLDEAEAFRCELAGLLEAIESGHCPQRLSQVTIVERNPGRVRRLQRQLRELLPNVPEALLPSGASRSAPTSQLEPFRSAGVESQAKAHVFVAMPFAPEFDDRFHYGIQQAVNTAGYLCERADLATFTGDVIAWVKQRIDTASLLVADLSTANPNVYLEVGYAWGKGIPTVLLAEEAADLRFDVKGQRCLMFKTIRTLEELLTRELKKLRAKAV
jgi:hypothetical protein